MIEQLLTEHLDTWTQAVETKSAAGRGSSKKLKLHGIAKLRELILELAVRGQLVPQDENDEPASVLLERIAAERERLVKEKKIKKPKVLPEISEDEKPYGLPIGWKYSRLGEISEFVNGYAFKSSDFTEVGAGIVKIGDIQNGVISTSSMSRVPEAVVEALDNSLKVNKGDMLIAMSGATTGKLGFNILDEVFYLNQRVGKIVPYLTDRAYLYIPLTLKIAENLAKSLGSAIPNISTKQINEIILPIPPLKEQNRIVAKVDELMALCDALEYEQESSIAAHEVLVENLLAALTNAADKGEFKQAWARVAGHFDTLFTTEQSVEQLSRQVIYLAASGKFAVGGESTKREPADILEIARQEKQLLIEKGEIKQEKIKPINIDISYGDIPDGWTLCCLNDVTSCLDHIRKPIKKSERSEGDVPYYGANGPVGFIGEHLFDEELILVVEDETFIGRVKPFSYKITGKAWVNNHAHVLQCTSVILPDFLNILLSYYPFIPLTSGTTGRKKLTKNTLLQIPIIVPQLREQEAIVKQVGEFLSVCEILKSNISMAQSVQIQLANVLVEQSVA